MASSDFIVRKGLQVGGSATIAGNLTVLGQTTTVNQEIVTTSEVITGNVDATNITASGKFYGDGSQLTGLPAGYTNANVAAYLPTYAGNVAAAYFNGNGAYVTNVPGATNFTTANVSAYLPSYNGNIGAVLTHAAQTNITSVGTLGSLAVTGNVTAGHFVGDGSLLTGMPAGYTDANVDLHLPNYAGNLGGTLTTASQPNITGVGTLGSLAVTNNVTANGVIASTVGGTLTTAAQPNITSVGTLVGLTVAGAIVPSANVTYNLGSPTLRWKDLYLSGNTIVLGDSSISTSAGGAVTISALNTGSINTPAIGNVGTLITGTIQTASQPNITGVGTLTAGSIGSGFTAIPNSALANSALTVNGVSIALGGSQTVTAAAGTLTGATLASGVTASSLTSVGTLGSLTVTGNVSANGYTGTQYGAVNTSTGSFSGTVTAGTFTAGNISLTGDTMSSTNSTITIDPSTPGAGGLVVIAGNLQVTGTTTTVNSTTTTVDALNMTLANTAANASQANGAGILIHGAGANLTYSSGSDVWTSTKGMTVTGNVGATYFNGSHTGSGAGLTSIPNGALTNSSTTIGNTAISLGSSATTIMGLTQLNANSINGNLSVNAGGSLYFTGPTNSIVIQNGGTAGTGNIASAGTAFNYGYFTNLVGTVQTAAQPNITSVGTLSSLTTSGNVSFTGTGNRILGDFSNATASNRVAFQSSTTNGATYVQLIPNGSATDSAITLWNSSDTTNASWFNTDLNATGAILNTGAVGSGTQKPILLQISGSTIANVASTGVTVTGQLTASGAFTVNSGNGVTAIINGGTNGVGNIGTATTGFNTVYAKATSAVYADVAENYLGDTLYEPGTVIDFGGDEEVTLSSVDGSKAVAGVVSTNPAYLMNDKLAGAHVTAVAFVGRVPTKVCGEVRKGDLMVSAGNGRARAEANPAVGSVIGKALANSSGDAVIEVVISRG